MLAHLIALLALAQPAAPAQADAQATIFATVGQSEWCPAGNISLDLRTGRYAFTATAPRSICNDETLRRPVRSGRLGLADLEAVRQAYLAAQAEGLTAAPCRDGRRPTDIIISNGGPRVMVVTTGARTTAAPDLLACWSPAARDLHRTLEQVTGPWRQP